MHIPYLSFYAYSVPQPFLLTLEGHLLLLQDLQENKVKREKELAVSVAVSVVPSQRLHSARILTWTTDSVLTRHPSRGRRTAGSAA